MPDARSISRADWSAPGVARRAVDLVEVLLLTDEPEPRAVAQVLRAHGESDPIRLSRLDIRQMRAGAGALYEVFGAPDVDRAAALLNELLARHAHPPRLTTHDGTTRWHLHVDSRDDAPWAEWFLSSSCLALATLLADRQALPGGICAAQSCRKPFLDNGSGGPRRYCSARCATRERVAAHRRARSGE